MSSTPSPSSTSLLPASLQSSLEQIIKISNTRSTGIQAILLSTADGVALGRVLHQANLPESFLQTLESLWAPASKQFPFLRLGKLQYVTADYAHGVLLHVYSQLPLVITVLLSSHSNMGSVRATTIPLLEATLGPLARELVVSLQPEAAYLS